MVLSLALLRMALCERFPDHVTQLADILALGSLEHPFRHGQWQTKIRVLTIPHTYSLHFISFPYVSNANNLLDQVNLYRNQPNIRQHLKSISRIWRLIATNHQTTRLHTVPQRVLLSALLHFRKCCCAVCCPSNLPRGDPQS